MDFFLFLSVSKKKSWVVLIFFCFPRVYVSRRQFKKISCELYLFFWGINRWVKILISRTKNIIIVLKIDVKIE